MGMRQALIADKLLKLMRENWIYISALAAAVWTLYQFMNTRAIPLNVSIDLATNIDPSAKNDLPAASDAESAVPITITAIVENKSDWRELAIKKPVWVAYGFRLGAPVDGNGKQVDRITPAEMQSRINAAFASNNKKSGVNYIGDRRLHSYSYTKELIGAGLLLGDSSIQPRERLSSQLVLPVPRHTFDFVQVRAYVPTLYQLSPNRYDSMLTIAERNQLYESGVLFCIKEKTECSILTKDKQPPGGQIHTSVSEIWLGKDPGE